MRGSQESVDHRDPLTIDLPIVPIGAGYHFLLFSPMVRWWLLVVAPILDISSKICPFP